MRGLIIIFSLLYLSGGALVAEDSLTTLDFFQFPTIQNPAISYDGAHVAYGFYADNNSYIVIKDLETGKISSSILVEKNSKKRLSYLAWATSDRLIYQMVRGSIWAVNADGSKLKKLWRFKDAPGILQVPRVSYLLRDEKDHIIISESEIGIDFQTRRLNQGLKYHRTNIHRAEIPPDEYSYGKKQNRL